jgi:hypothetical protein
MFKPENLKKWILQDREKNHSQIDEEPNQFGHSVDMGEALSEVLQRVVVAMSFAIARHQFQENRIRPMFSAQIAAQVLPRRQGDFRHAIQRASAAFTSQPNSITAIA